MDDQTKRFNAQNATKKILVAGGGGNVANPKQFVVTQSKGTTIIQPAAVVHGSSSAAQQQQQQYIVTVGGGAHGSQNSEHSVSYPSTPTVQYLDASTRPVSTQEPVVYTTSQQASNNVQYQYADGGYSSPSAHYSYGASNPQFHGAGEVVQHMGQTFYLQSGTMDGEGYPLAHTTRAAPATVKWLLENFEPCDGVSLPRSVLYNFYIHHCRTENVEPSNPASFGKLVRMIFRDLKTRRLGQRGNSRYHYYGIRLKPSSGLNQLMPDETPVAMRQPTHPQRRVFKSTNVAEDGDSNPVTPKSEPNSVAGELSAPSTPHDQHRQFLGPAIDAIPRDVHIIVETNCIPDGITQHDLHVFTTLYKEHCEAILDVVINLQFNQIEGLWQQFWRKPTSVFPSLEGKLSKDKLFVLSHMSEVQRFVKQMDYMFYQSLVEVLIPDVLRPIPGTLTSTIRNVAKNLEGWLRSALTGAPDDILKTKLTALTAFSQTLRRYTSLNHLAQAARAVFDNATQIQQMMTDLARVDFSNIQEQAAWVCQCSDVTVRNVEEKFKDFLLGQHSLEEWRDWLEKMLDEVLVAYEGEETYSKAARDFLLKWSFYSSMVIRDLTLRSAVSFGSFHLIRLLYDEYLFYLVEHKVAAATSRTPIAVMSELIENNDQLRLSNQKSAKTSLPSMASLNSRLNKAMTKSTAMASDSSGASGDDEASPPKRFRTDSDPLGVALHSIK